MGGRGGFLAVLAVWCPQAFKLPNRLWFRLGLALNRVITPLVMALIFLFAVLPTGLLMRSLGKDVLRLRRDPEAATYWIARMPDSHTNETMKQQF